MKIDLKNEIHQRKVKYKYVSDFILPKLSGMVPVKPDPAIVLHRKSSRNEKKQDRNPKNDIQTSQTLQLAKLRG
jgi:hypothetical protein